jgi:hypothetical protein
LRSLRGQDRGDMSDIASCVVDRVASQSPDRESSRQNGGRDGHDREDYKRAQLRSFGGSGHLPVPVRAVTIFVVRPTFISL